ncbi:MAG TPA: RDD family protein, partial [Solirubrobacterales bacterium]|nr:RDD family protein [Solirubrobacterales bacterium]
GIDRAVEAAAEEAMVAAVESEAVERALARVLRGPVVEDAVQGALESEAVKRALVDALDSELVDEVWRRLLASDEAQRLVERIAEAPEIRAAISAQSVGLIGDLGRTIGNTARRLDDGIERIVRRIFFRRRRLDPTDRAGALTRALAFAVDGFIINLSFSGLAAVAALIASAFWGTNGGVSDLALALGTGAWLVLGGVYMAGFWCLAGQTPGMRFLGIRLGDPGYRLSFGQALRRLFGFSLCVATLGIGFLGIVFGERRRAWDDSLSGSEVLYDDRRAEPAPWSTLAGAEAGAEGASETTKAPSSRGLRAQQVADRPLSG